MNLNTPHLKLLRCFGGFAIISTVFTMLYILSSSDEYVSSRSMSLSLQEEISEDILHQHKLITLNSSKQAVEVLQVSAATTDAIEPTDEYNDFGETEQLPQIETKNGSQEEINGFRSGSANIRKFTWNHSIEETFQNRKSDIQSVCQKHHEDISKISHFLHANKRYRTKKESKKRIIIDSRLNIGMCYQAKGGSAFWKYFFAHLKERRGVFTFQERRDFKHKMLLAPKQLNAEKDLKHIKLFVFNRSPWDRLVSLFRQKIERQSAKDATYRYVRGACQGLPFATFQQLLECALKTWLRGSPDPHWEPLFTSCNICNVPYQIFGSTKDMNTEAAQILKSLGMKGNIQQLLDQVRETTMRNSEKKTARVDYSSYYKDIPESLIAQLQDMYKYDILMFSFPQHPLSSS